MIPGAAVIDASVAIKWVIEEEGSLQALTLRQSRLFAPDIWCSECANVLWKSYQRQSLTLEEAVTAAALLESADIEIISSRPLMERAVRMAVEIGHPVYDCVYVLAAIDLDMPLVTADERLQAKAANITPIIALKTLRP
ncbi:MAG: type II toxin-antitoxin system VapC family toxin [Rhodospirillales bacterium]